MDGRVARLRSRWGVGATSPREILMRGQAVVWGGGGRTGWLAPWLGQPRRWLAYIGVWILRNYRQSGAHKSVMQGVRVRLHH